MKNRHKAVCLFDSEKYPQISGNPSLNKPCVFMAFMKSVV